MGMFDSVWIKCNCGRNIEFQSKAGDCMLYDYEFPSAPQEILLDLDNQEKTCKYCERTAILHTSTPYIEFKD